MDFEGLGYQWSCCWVVEHGLYQEGVVTVATKVAALAHACVAGVARPVGREARVDQCLFYSLAFASLGSHMAMFLHVVDRLVYPPLWGEYALPIHLLCLRFPTASTLAGLTQISHNFTLLAPLLYARPSTLCQHRHVMVAPARAQVPKWNATRGNCSRLRGRKRFAVEIRYLVAPPQEAEYPADPRKSEQLLPAVLTPSHPPATIIIELLPAPWKWPSRL